MKPLDIVSHNAASRPSLYDERLVGPMRRDLVEVGFTELRTPAEVDRKLQEAKGTVLLVVNSVCGCAAGRARPGVKLALQRAARRPDHLFTVFAGQDRDATDRARSYFAGKPPTSPQVALLRDGQLLYLMQRHQIEGREAPEIAQDLVEAMDKYCVEG